MRNNLRLFLTAFGHSKIQYQRLHCTNNTMQFMQSKNDLSHAAVKSLFQTKP